MACMTVSAAARVVVPLRARSCPRAAAPCQAVRTGARGAPGAAVRLRGASQGRGRGSTIIANAGLPPNLAGMMGNMDPEKMKEIQAAYEQAMKDPETAKKVNDQMAQMSGMMNNPMVAKQMSAMNNMISNPDMQKRIAGLKDDPDFQNFFNDVQKNGPSAMMKYSSDTAFLKKLNDKLGKYFPFTTFRRLIAHTRLTFIFTFSGGEEAIRAAVGGDIPVVDVPGGAPAAPPAPAPEVETLHDAARYGDQEAVEDFIAVGKDVDARDSSKVRAFLSQIIPPAVSAAPSVTSTAVIKRKCTTGNVSWRALWWM
jgi:hypothetical protein